MWWKLLSCLDISRLVPGVRLKSFRYASMPRSVPERFARNRSRGGCLSLWEMGVVCPYVQRIVNVWRASAGLSQQVSLARSQIQMRFTCHAALRAFPTPPLCIKRHWRCLCLSCTASPPEACQSSIKPSFGRGGDASYTHLHTPLPHTRRHLTSTLHLYATTCATIALPTRLHRLPRLE
jgi:hypothetical protein